MRATLTTISVAALLAAGAGSAAARPADVPIPGNDAPPPAQTDVPTARTDAAQHAQAIRSLGLHNRHLPSSRLRPARTGPDRARDPRRRRL